MRGIDWEDLGENKLGHGIVIRMFRAKVPGGWLIMAEPTHRVGEGGPSLVFYPDPAHEWDGQSLP
jgi:hypothetical protein